MKRRETCPDCEGDLKPLKILDSAYHTVTQLTYGTGERTPGIFGYPSRSGVIDAVGCEECGRVLLYANPAKYNDLSDWKPNEG